MKRVFLALSVTLFLNSCGERVEVPPPEALPRPGATAPLPINIGDVEVQVHVFCNVSEEFEAPENVVVNRTNVRHSDLGMVTVDLYPPYPTSIPILVTVKKDMPKKDPMILVLRGNVLRDEQPIHPFQLVLTETSDKVTKVGDVEVLSDLSAPPETMLVNAVADAVLLPADTDLSTVDLATVQGTVETQSVLFSNPVRINFNPAKDSP